MCVCVCVCVCVLCMCERERGFKTNRFKSSLQNITVHDTHFYSN